MDMSMVWLADPTSCHCAATKLQNSRRGSLLLIINCYRPASCAAGLAKDTQIYSGRERARWTISTNTFRVSAGLLTSCKNAMRAPRMPLDVFTRT
jgi:hypothetical protein